MIVDKAGLMVGKRRKIKCVCDACGDEFMRRSDSTSHDFCVPCANKKSGEKRRTHGENNRNSRLHVVWNNMLNRCRNEKNKRYKHYGARGIFVCDEWLSYESFRDWALENGYSDDLTIDRINNDKGYFPDNCRFVDKSFQNANRSAIRTNKSGFVGVWWDRGAYCARVVFSGEIVNLGRFKELEDAVNARDSYIINRGWPHQLSGIESLSTGQLKQIKEEYKAKLKELKASQL